MKVLLTGVGKGFGRSYLEYISLQNKYEILGLTRNLNDFNDQEVDQLNKKNVVLQSIDLSCSESVHAFIKQNIDFLNSVDILINNAGQRFRYSVDQLEYQKLESLFRVNVITPMILSSAVLKGMKKRKSGRIINISSILGSSGLAHLSGYSATKGAIDSMTRSMAVEYAEFNITINAIAPGFCETSYADSFKKNHELNQEIIERIPMKRWGKANEINGILDFLISSNASYITGQVLNVDGGWTS
jgi:NAD(P)-dependent dehydrogenase (short-subunit alcohol dehydrogenase family)|tara:strand:+ start:10070 stop:10801 length:732 start_codon:yes stop_codon:yes gene_type:complete